MTQDLQTSASGERDKFLPAELVPEQVLPKVMTTFGLTATYVFIICWITGSSVMAAGGWTAIPMWVLGIITFLVPAGMAVAELGNLWPGEGGVYIWATRTMGETWGFIGGYLSWIPVILNAASSPAIIVQFLLLAFHAELGLTLSIIIQLVILWAVVGLALAKLAANQQIMRIVFMVYGVLTAVIFISGLVYALRNGSGTPFDLHAATVPDFAGNGFLYGTVLLYLLGVETPYNMGAEFLSVRKSGPKMVVWGSIALIVIYLLTTLGTMMVLPSDQIDPVTGVIGMLATAAPKGVMEAAAIVLAGIIFIALMTYQVTYSRLIFVSGLERHLPRIFTHLNPRTRNPVTAILIQGVLSSLILVALYSQSSMANVTIFIQGGLSTVWLISGFFFLIPLIVARKKYADRYASETFWRIPGGMTGVWITVIVGSLGTIGGVYYSFAKSWIKDVPDSEWMTWTGGISIGMIALGVVVYFFGRRGRAQDHRGGLAGTPCRPGPRQVQHHQVEDVRPMTLDSTTMRTETTGGGTSYPLDPLTGEEIQSAAAVIMASEYASPTLKFVMIQLAEPAKTAGLTFEGLQTPRCAFASMYDAAAKMIYEAVVDLGARVIESWTSIPGRFPSYLVEHMTGVEEKVREDPRWQEAMRKRGITDFSLAMIDPWPAGYCGSGDHYDNSPLVCRPLTFMRAAPSEHGYARPVEGLIVTFDLDSMKIIDIEDHGVVPIPPTAGNYDPRFMFDSNNRPAFSEFRSDVKPIEITQPEGPSFTVDGWKVQWQKWSLRIGFNPREGLTLHEVTYTDRGEMRPIMYRGSLSEMVVPYGDTSPTHWNKNVFDMGEVGMGFSANPLTLGCDCLGEIHYFDGTVNDSAGNAVTIPNAICMHEEDYGISWKHTDFRTEEVEVRRSRRLVISMICTVGNYEYGFFWYFYNDASIEVEVKLSGVLTTGAVEDGEVPRWGKLVAPGVYGPNHQHFFNYRLDMSVDGPGNSVYEVDSVPEPDPALNPHHNAWVTQDTLVASEADGARDWEWKTGRYWKIANPSKKNELGSPTAYKLVPKEIVPVMVQEGSYIYDRARFVQHNLWVTKYDESEKFAAGDYMYQSADAQGLPEFIADDAPLENTDVVLWYTLGAHHVVRPEDWPVMPCAYTGFHLKPIGFFDGNPALDIPPSPPKACHGAHHAGLPVAERARES